VTEVSASAFYSWTKKPGTDKNRQREALEVKARQLFNGHRQTYGYRRLANELGKADMKSGHYQVRRLMSSGLEGTLPQAF
jgi:hypothetical protein